MRQRESVCRHHALIVRIGLRVGSSVRDAARLKQPIAELREFHRVRVVQLVISLATVCPFLFSRELLIVRPC